MPAEKSPLVPQSLLDWPYATRQLLQTPHPEVIEAHARNLLSRALNIGRLTAFVGSGASMAYGRISWIDMLYAAQQAVLKRYEAKETKLNEAGTHIERLATLLKEHRIERDGNNEASSQLTIFQLAEELEKAIDAAEIAEGKHPTRTFRETIMWVTRDDRGHAEQLLRSAFLDRDISNQRVRYCDFMENSPFKKYLDGAGKEKEASIEDEKIECLIQYTLWGGYNLPFKGRHFPPLLEAGEKNALNDAIEALGIKGNPKLDFEEFFRSPSLRYRLAAQLRILSERERFKVLEVVALELNQRREARQRAEERERSVHQKRRSSRSAIAPHSRDPLLILHQELRIRRFLTTNYDHEIERLLEDCGYSRSPEEFNLEKLESGYTDDPIAPVFKEIIFSQKWTGELAALATSDRSRRRANWVVHLHGRAEVDGGSIIVTEDDYQRHYARDDERRSSIDDATKLAFSAQPVVFVGIGMDEVDLLRPLRDFMSETTRLGDRLAVTLLSATGTKKEEEARKIHLLRRYGVYTIHYGWASITRENQQTKTRWLNLLKTLKDKMDEVLKLFSKLRPPANSAEKETSPANQDKKEESPLSVCKSIETKSKEFNDWLSERLKSKPEGIFFSKNSGSITIQEPHALEDIPLIELESLGSSPTLKDEIGVIKSTITFIQRLSQATLPPRGDWSQKYREAQSHRVQLAGAYNAINTLCLCAALLRIVTDWKKWREDWWRLPQPVPIDRDAEEREEIKKLDGRDIRVLSRHAVDLPQLKSLSPNNEIDQYKRFYAGARSQTFNFLMSALRKEQDTIQKYSGRRIFLLIARRGVGKGHFFSALQPHDESSERLSEFLYVIGSPKKEWAGATFFNFSFSLEVESVFDQLALFLWKCWFSTIGENEKAIQNDWDSIQGNRLERLRYVLRLCKEKIAKGKTPLRVLAAFNGISVMFDRYGRAKNGHIQKLFETLIDYDFEALPIDFLFVCTENAVPEYFCRPTKEQSDKEADNDVSAARVRRPSLSLHELRRENLPEEGKLAVSAHFELLNLNIQPRKGRSFSFSKSKSGNFVHLLHEVRASVLVNAFFPSVALIIAWAHLRKLTESEKNNFAPFTLEHKAGGYKNFFDMETALATRLEFKDPWWTDDAGHHTPGCPLLNQRELFPQLMVLFALAFEKRPIKGNPEQGPKPSEILYNLRKSHNCAENLDAQTLTTHLLKTSGLFEESQSIPDELCEQFRQVAKSVDDFMKEIYNAVGRGRYTFTVLAAATYEKFFSEAQNTQGQTNSDEICYDIADRSAKRCIEFLENLCFELRNQREPRRDDIVIERVLHIYKTLHEDDKALPILLWAGGQLKTGADVFHLQQLILWHLSVIGLPVQAEVLALCPLIKKAIRNSWKNPKPPRIDEEHKKKLLNELLNLLEFRCLIFRVKPHLGKEASSEHNPARYSVHRRVQRHIFTQMGAPFVEYPEVDQFSLTLSARQPNDIPRLSPTAHADLRKTVAMLSGYPEDNEAIAQFDGVKSDNEKSQVVKTFSLRAAYGILRSVYSVSGVARFDVEHERIETGLGIDGGLFGLGFFEEHRQQIRWLGEQAKKLAKAGSKDAPFFAGEIVWLYNECGVLSLLQGRLPDAFALFGLALRALDTIEPRHDGPGPLRALVLLNQAVVDMERGRVRRAAQTFESLIPIFSEAEEEAKLIAKGYLAITYHLSGDFHRAGEIYKEVIKKLVNLRKSRSASIFHRHHADLLRRCGDLKEAKTEVEAAIQLAQEGSHEDVRHLAILSEAKIMIESGKKYKPEPIHSRLDMVERYARVMGVPRMTAEVHELRARLHFSIGDLRTAGTFARRSLEVASLHELQLRKATVLMLYAQINLKRGFKKACRPLLEEALTITRDTEYYTAYLQAQDIWHDLERAGDTDDDVSDPA